MFEFFSSSGIITLIVIIWLSVYIIATFWIFFYKLFSIKNLYNKESVSLELILSKRIPYPKSAVFSNSNISNVASKEMLNIWKSHILKSASVGLVFLSIVSSTAPFIGLFGTVTEILEAFSRLGGSQASFDIIAPVISKALVATAWGILSAIPAYSFYAILRRKLSELSVCLQSQIDVTLALATTNAQEKPDILASTRGENKQKSQKSAFENDIDDIFKNKNW